MNNKLCAWRNALVILMIFSCLFLSGCPRAKNECAELGTSFTDQADKIYPPSVELQDYRRAYTIYQRGDSEDALAIVRRLANRPLVLAPDSVLEDSRYFTVYASGREADTLSLFRRISRLNRDYAKELADAGQKTESLAVLRANLDMARQIVRASPHDYNMLATGGAIWILTWDCLSQQLSAWGEPAAAKLAASCSERARAFADDRLAPLVSKFGEELTTVQGRLEPEPKNQTGYSMPAEISGLLREQQVRIKELITAWDTEVDTPSCQAILNSGTANR